MGKRKFRFNDLGIIILANIPLIKQIFFQRKRKFNNLNFLFYLVIPFNNPEIIACLGVATPLGLVMVLGI